MVKFALKLLVNHFSIVLKLLWSLWYVILLSLPCFFSFFEARRGWTPYGKQTALYGRYHILICLVWFGPFFLSLFAFTVQKRLKKSLKMASIPRCHAKVHFLPFASYVHCFFLYIYTTHNPPYPYPY